MAIEGKGSVIGNLDLISDEEKSVAQMLRERNLAHTNEISEKVHPKNSFYTRVVKRALDITISLPGCLVLLPLNVIIGICTFFDVGRPILYRQTRVGRNGKFFTLVKFRNMNEKKDANGRLLPPAQRVTKFGYFMRKYSFDELLNFWSVLKGDMSIIGPRPAPVFIHERMSDRHKMRTAVRPGLECPRVIHVDQEDIYKYQRTYENDIWYVENVSFLLDVKMLFLLVKMAFSFGKRDQQANVQGVSYFVGYDENGNAMGMNTYRRFYSPDGKRRKEDEAV